MHVYLPDSSLGTASCQSKPKNPEPESCCGCLRFRPLGSFQVFFKGSFKVSFRVSFKVAFESLGLRFMV